MSYEMVLKLDLRALGRLSRVIGTFDEILALKWAYFMMKRKDKIISVGKMISICSEIVLKCSRIERNQV